jgi:tetratricopeptide (TPR) repeat protein
LSAAVGLIGPILFSCSDSGPVRLRHEAEKKFFHAEKMSRDLGLRPELLTADQQMQIKTSYRESLDFARTALDSVDRDRNPQEFKELSSLAHRSAVRLCRLYSAERQFDSCVAILTPLESNLALSPIELMSVYVSLGQSLQATGDFDSAVVVYTKAIDDFYPPIDESGEPVLGLLNIPLHLTRVFTRVGDQDNVDRFSDWSESYYLGLIEAYPGSRLAVASHANLARLYDERGRWLDAVTHLRALTDSTGQPAVTAQLRIGDTYAARLRQFDSAMNVYDELSGRLAGSDTILRPVIFFKKCLVEFERKNYGRARQLLVDLAKNFPAYYRAYPTAQYVKAQTFEMEGNWDRAETEYKFLIDEYPTSEEAMTTHLYLIDRLAELGRTVESEHWYERTTAYLDDLAERGAGGLLEAMALTYRAELHRRRGEWVSALQTLARITARFADRRIGQNSLLAAAGIYREELNDPLAADSVLEIYKRTQTAVDEAAAE